MYADSKGRVWEGGAIVYDPDDEANSSEVFTPENLYRVNLYASALDELVEEDRRFDSNYNVFQRWGIGQRIWWINQIEQQAKDGKNTVGVLVVTRAAILRLSRG